MPSITDLPTVVLVLLANYLTPVRCQISAFSASQGVQSACGRTGYYACPASLGGGCCPTDLICGITDCQPELQRGKQVPLPDCPGYSGFFLCPTSLGEGCCPGGYMCNGPKTNCRLTLRLYVTTDVYNTTKMSGSTPISTYLVTTTSLEGDEVTAVARIQPPTPTPSTKQGRLRERPSQTNSTSKAAAIKTSKVLDLGKDHESTSNAEEQTIMETTNNAASSPMSLTGAQITGIVVGSTALLSLLSLGIFLVVRYRKGRFDQRRNDSYESHEKAELDASDSCSPSELASKLDITELPVASQSHELSASLDVFELDSEPVSRRRSSSTISGRRPGGEPGSTDRIDT
ncbi:hypothetical protein V8F20_012241 [Naviculisporaceae sp. PSN 640]